MTSKKFCIVGAMLFPFLYAFGQASIQTLRDHGKMGGLGVNASYMLHFKVSQPDYPLNRVVVSFNEEDTVLQSNPKGVYRLKLKVKRGVPLQLGIGNVAHDKWRNNEVWSEVKTIEIPELERPIAVSFPYERPTMTQITKWANMGKSQRDRMLRQNYGMVLRPVKDAKCARFVAPEYQFDFTYDFESCTEMMTIQYGVYNTEYPSELQWAQEITADLKNELQHNFEGTKAMRNVPVEVYRYKYRDTSVLIYLVEDKSSRVEGGYSYNVRLMIRWE